MPGNVKDERFNEGPPNAHLPNDSSMAVTHPLLVHQLTPTAEDQRTIANRLAAEEVGSTSARHLRGGLT